MQRLYDFHYIFIGIIAAHSILASSIGLSAKGLLVEALIGLTSLVIFAWIDFCGYTWRSPLCRRVGNYEINK